MVHHVIEQVDRGSPILVRDVVIEAGESLEQLEAKMHGVEHELIVEATAIKAKEAIAKKASS